MGNVAGTTSETKNETHARAPRLARPLVVECGDDALRALGFYSENDGLSGVLDAFVQDLTLLSEALGDNDETSFAVARLAARGMVIRVAAERSEVAHDHEVEALKERIAQLEAQVGEMASESVAAKVKVALASSKRTKAKRAAASSR